jgi:hypothetical protein
MKMWQNIESIKKLAEERHEYYQKEAEVWRRIPRMTLRVKVAGWMRMVADRLEPLGAQEPLERTI